MDIIHVHQQTSALSATSDIASSVSATLRKQTKPRTLNWAINARQRAYIIGWRARRAGKDHHLQSPILKGNTMQITIIGRLGQDVSLRYTASGKAVAQLSVAESHRKKDASGTWQDSGVTWWEATLWEAAAENATEHLRKGDRVIVTGDTFTEEFTRKDGTAGKALKVRAEEVGKSLRFGDSGGSRGATQAAVSDPWGSTAADSSSAPF